MRVLWLTSWYPNKINKTNGDFVQRQARATSLFCKVDLIHVEAGTNNLLEKNIERTYNVQDDLTETIVLYKASRYLPKVNSFLEYKRLFKKELKQYIQKNGLPDVVHVHVPMKSGIIALWLKKKYGISYIVSEHWTIYADNAAHTYLKRSFVFKLFTKKIFEEAALFLSVSKNLAELICNKVVNISYRVIYNVVDVNFFNYEKINTFSFTFIHVSTLKQQKNPGLIINAFLSFRKLHPNTRLLIVGDIPEDLVQYVSLKNMNDEGIKFTGFTDYENVAAYLKQSNVFVLFSRYENMPCAVLEALCCGLPVITSNVGGLSEVIDDSNGIIVKEYSKDALTKAMIEVYETYHKYHRQNISANAIEKFSYETIGKQVKNIYEEVKLRNLSTHH